MPEELPSQSNRKMTSKFINEAQHSSLMDRLQNKESEFHHFVESSRVLHEEGARREPTEFMNQDQPQPASFQQFSKISVSNSNP